MSEHPDDLTLSTDEELVEWKRETRERLARRRPMGFTATWEPPAEQAAGEPPT